MGPAIAKFLQAAISLAKKGVKETDILKAAKQEFGEVSDLLKIQIRRLYKNKDAPSIKNPEKDAISKRPGKEHYSIEGFDSSLPHRFLQESDSIRRKQIPKRWILGLVRSACCAGRI